MKIVNRNFNREFELIESYEAGIVLTGAEVKSIKAGALKLEAAHVKLVGDEPYLVNAEIAPYQFARRDEYDPKKSRKLLLRRDEIVRIKTKLHGASGLTLAPVACYNKGPYIKLEIALVRGRKDIEKRKIEKLKKVERRDKQEAKEYMKR